MHQPLTHLTIYISNELNKHALLRTPTLVDEFSNMHQHPMQRFCKESEDPEFDMDLHPMLLETYYNWQTLYQQLTRGDSIAIEFDYRLYASRLTFNYYRRENTLILMCDLFPQEMQDNPFEYKLFMQRRCSLHEGVLNRTH